MDHDTSVMDQIIKCLICYKNIDTVAKYKFSTSTRSKNSQARVSQAICFVFHKHKPPPPDLIAQLNKFPDLCCAKCVKELLRISEIRDQLMELEEQLSLTKGNVEKKFLTIHQKMYEEGHGGSNSVSYFKLRWDLFNSKERDRNADDNVDNPQLDAQSRSRIDEIDDVDFEPSSVSPPTPNQCKRKKKKDSDDSDDSDWEPVNKIGRELILKETPENVDKEMKSECLTRKPQIILTKMSIINEQSFNINNDWIQIFTKSENERLEKDRSRSKRKCRFCHKVFFDKYILQKHILAIHSTNKPSKQPCSLCGAMIAPNNLRAHFKRKHPTTVYEKSAQNNANDDAGIPHHCHICDRNLYDQRALKLHFMRIHNKGICEKLCLKCGKTYRTEKLLNLHMKRSHLKSSKSICCEICGNSFQDKANLKVHMRNKHQMGGPPLLTCDQCGVQKFQYQSQLDIHIKKVHQGVEGPFKCHKENCSKSYFTPSALAQHLKKSHGKVVCRICGKHYLNLGYLNIHTKQIHEKEYHHFCKYSGCKKGFFSIGCLNRHEKQHYISDNFDNKCKICFKNFSSPRALKVHELSHTVEESGFECPSCKLKFISESKLEYHTLFMHSGKGTCKKCGKIFSTQHNLNRHMKTCT